MSEEDSKSVAFNLSVMQIQEVFRLLSMSNDQYLKGRYEDMLHSLKCCKLSVIQNLSEEERDKLKEMENEIEPLLYKQTFLRRWRNFDIDRNDQLMKNIHAKLSKSPGNFLDLLEGYKIYFMDVLEKHGYLIKKMEDFKKMF